MAVDGDNPTGGSPRPQEEDREGRSRSASPQPCRLKEEVSVKDEEAPRTPATMPPQEERIVVDGPPEPVVVVPEPQQVLRLTNFSIAEILKPSFGSVVCKRRRTGDSDNGRHQHLNQERSLAYHHHHNHHHHHPYSPSNSSSSSSSSSRGSPHSPRDSHSHGHYQGLVPSAPRVLLASPRALSPSLPLPSPGQRSTGDSDDNSSEGLEGSPDKPPILWPAWVYCTRYSDRPSSGPRSRKIKKREKKPEEKRPRTAFTNEQLSRLKTEFDDNRYLTEQRRQELARELQLNESQIKIWFQNKRAKMKKASGTRNSLALQLMAQGLYNHSTMPLGEGGVDPQMK